MRPLSKQTNQHPADGSPRARLAEAVGKATVGVDGVDFSMLMDTGLVLRCMIDRTAISALVGRPVASWEMLDAFERFHNPVQTIVVGKVEREQIENGMIFVELRDVPKQQRR